jgi:cell division protein FtsX
LLLGAVENLEHLFEYLLFVEIEVTEVLLVKKESGWEKLKKSIELGKDLDQLPLLDAFIIYLLTLVILDY